MFDAAWLLLLLPAAAGTGWYLGRREQKSAPAINLPSAYFQGLNFLLNEQPDKAIEVFLKVLEVDSETVEMHLALGNLFRRRGEIERATRIHQNLIARPNLEEHHRLQALFQLAQDYLRAGLLDRAESLLLELSDVDRHAESALRLLKDIYEQESEWEKAVDVLRRLEKIQGTDQGP
ncbi:MAG TPA: tetratricopeptide repeat protein, partial [Arenicellales bacterium]|nr:tetratricopeptide repeat protein [Arenicellales bacterium]